jgi:hypothetical protein
MLDEKDRGGRLELLRAASGNIPERRSKYILGSTETKMDVFSVLGPNALM